MMQSQPWSFQNCREPCEATSGVRPRVGAGRRGQSAAPRLAGLGNVHPAKRSFPLALRFTPPSCIHQTSAPTSHQLQGYSHAKLSNTTGLESMGRRHVARSEGIRKGFPRRCHLSQGDSKGSQTKTGHRSTLGKGGGGRRPRGRRRLPPPLGSEGRRGLRRGGGRVPPGGPGLHPQREEKPLVDFGVEGDTHGSDLHCEVSVLGMSGGRTGRQTEAERDGDTCRHPQAGRPWPGRDWKSHFLTQCHLCMPVSAHVCARGRTGWSGRGQWAPVPCVGWRCACAGGAAGVCAQCGAANQQEPLSLGVPRWALGPGQGRQVGGRAGTHSGPGPRLRPSWRRHAG